MLKEVDIAALLYLLTAPRASYAQIGAMLGVSKSTAHQAVERLRRAGLLHVPERGVFEVARGPAREFLLFGVRYAALVDTVPRARGISTGLLAVAERGPAATAAPLVAVWPSPLGETVGLGVKPLVPGAPDTALRHPRFYRLLALVDALRLGDVREREEARRLLEQEFDRDEA